MEIPPDDFTKQNGATDERPVTHSVCKQCKQCDRQFASISAQGGLIPFTRQGQDCVSCEPFLGLYEDLQTKEMEHTALLDRGPKHHGRAMAHEKLRNAKVALENFLINVEAPNTAKLEFARASSTDCKEPEQPEHLDNPESAGEFQGDQQAVNGFSSPIRHSLTTNASPTMKHRLACASNIERKRIKFTESVEERAEYRSVSEFYRGGKEYIPGRYVPAEGSEFLDTSGSTLTFAKFTGQRKIGSKFIDILPTTKGHEDVDEFPASHDRVTSQSEKVQLKPEQGESQTVDQEIRPSRRCRSVNPRRITRGETNKSLFGGSENNTLRASPKQSSLAAILELPSHAAAHMSTEEEVLIQSTEETEGHQESTLITSLDKAMSGSTEIADIKHILTNIQREFRHLNEATVSPNYRNLVGAAVRSFTAILQPLMAPDSSNPDGLVNAEEVQDEDSIYFEAHDTTAHIALRDIPEPAKSPKQDGITHTGAQTATKNRELQNPGVSRELDSEIPTDVQDNLMGIATSEATRTDTVVEAHPPLSPVNRVMQTGMESYSSSPQFSSKYRSSNTAEDVSPELGNVSNINMEGRNRSSVHVSGDNQTTAAASAGSSNRYHPEIGVNKGTTQESD